LISSEWCMQKWSEAIEAGDEKSAKDYQEMYEIWKRRETAK
jgi:hypothetical protein